MQLPTRELPAPATPPAPLLLGAQTIFNIGFYAVVPFIALVLAQNFALGATAVGLILGIRTFAQQGLFLLGGAFADYFGARAIMLCGVSIRVAGFLGLGWGTSLADRTPGLGLAIFIAGTVLTGLGGALFSPALNLYIARADEGLAAQEAAKVKARTTLFAWLNVTGEIGAVLGPLLGYALIGFGFSLVALVGTLVFVAIWFIFFFLLPKESHKQRQSESALTQSSHIISSMLAVVKDRKFARFAALHSVDLFCYNQLYFALPLVAAGSVSASNQLLASCFAAVSILIMVGQLPISRLCTRFSIRTVLGWGYSISALGLLSLALAQLLTSSSGTLFSQAFTLAGAVLIGAGHLTSSPQALNHVSAYAPATSKAAYLGFIATCGGAAVLVGNFLLGGLYDALAQLAPGTQWLAWAACAATVLLSALLQKTLSDRA